MKSWISLLIGLLSFCLWIKGETSPAIRLWNGGSKNLSPSQKEIEKGCGRTPIKSKLKRRTGHRRTIARWTKPTYIVKCRRRIPFSKDTPHFISLAFSSHNEIPLIFLRKLTRDEARPLTRKRDQSQWEWPNRVLRAVLRQSIEWRDWSPLLLFQYSSYLSIRSVKARKFPKPCGGETQGFQKRDRRSLTLTR